MKRTQKWVYFCFIVVLLLSLSQFALASEELIDQSIDTLYDLSKIADKDVFFYFLGKAEAIAIFPKVVRLGIGLGAQYGDGVVYRKGVGQNVWYGPAFFRIYGVSFGPQVGIQSTKLVLLIMNQEGMKVFYEDGLTLGGNVSVAAGPIGRSFSADVDIDLDSSIYSYSQSRGLYVGLSVQGAQIKQNREANHQFYRQKIDPEKILSSVISSNPSSLEFIQYLKELIQKNAMND